MILLQDIVLGLDVTTDIFKGRINSLEMFLYREKMNENFINKVTKIYYNRLWTVQKGATGKEIKKFISSRIYSTAIMECLQTYYKSIVFIKDQTFEFQNKLSSLMTSEVLITDDYVFKKGEIANKLFIVYSGQISLLENKEIFIFNSLKQINKGLSGENKVKERRKGHLSLTSKNKPSHSSNSSTTNKTNTSTDKANSYSTILEGTIGECEFFTRGIYSCNAKVTKDTLLFSIEFDIFFALVDEYHLRDRYIAIVSNHIDKLEKRSTLEIGILLINYITI